MYDNAVLMWGYMTLHFNHLPLASLAMLGNQIHMFDADLSSKRRTFRGLDELFRDFYVCVGFLGHQKLFVHYFCDDTTMAVLNSCSRS